MRVAFLLIAGACVPGLAASAESPIDPLDGLIEDLGAADWATREDAERRIVDWGPAARDRILPLLGDRDLEIRLRAGRILESLPSDPRRIPSLLEALEEFAREAPYLADLESPASAPVPDQIAQVVLELRHSGSRLHLGLLTEYGLRVHEKNLRYSRLSRALPLEENVLFEEWVRLTGVERCRSPVEGGWLASQFFGPFEPMWSSFQVYLWFKEAPLWLIEEPDNAARLESVLREIEDSGLAVVGGRNVCHYGCR